MVEILSRTPDGVDILKPAGEPIHISAEDINATHDVDYELYKDFTKSFNNTITPEQRKAIEYNNIYLEAVHSIADKINKDSNDIITTQLSGDNTLYNVVGGKVILDNNGNIDLSKSDDMVILRTPDGEHTPVYVESLRNTVIQSVNDTVQEIIGIQPEILDEKQSVKTDNSVLSDLKPGVNVTLTYQGKPYNAMVQQIDELGNPVYLLYDENNQPYQTITDEAENITVLDEKEKILSEIKSESDVQQPQNTEQPSLPESETSELPTHDYDNMPPEQLAQTLTAESTSEEAINLLNTTVSNIDKEINKLNKKESSSLNQAKNKKNKLTELKLRRQRATEAITIIQSENNSPVNTNIISEETPVEYPPIQLEQPINNYEQQSNY
ncbi:MAG: hypothetical protein ACLTTW_04270 [Coprobacter sp.]